MPARPRRPSKHVLFACVVCLALAGLAAQQPPATFKSGVEVVLIDVSVVDKTGHPVNDLTPADFTVTVDRKPRTLVSAQFLKYEVRTAATPGGGGAVAPVPSPPPVSQSPPPPRIVLVVIDEDSIEPVEGLAARQAVVKFLDRLAPNDRVGVTTIPRLRSEVTLSTRRSDVMKSLNAVITGVDVFMIYALHLERSTFGQVRNRPSPTAVEDDLLEREGIENATSVAGGTLMLGIGTLDQYFDRVATELAGSYLLGVEVEPTDRDGRTHQVDVKVNRRGVEVRARKRYLIEEPRPARAEAEPAKGGRAAKAKPGKDTTPAPITVELMTPETEDAVKRAGAYAAAYETALSGLVAEERYVQRSLKYQALMVTHTVTTFGKTTSTTEDEGEWVPDAERKLRSDFLLVKAHGGDRWTPFRDVFEVDGKAVREREQRLQRLFLEAPATAAERAGQINADSARFNIGFVERNVNLPTLALRYLDPAQRSRLLFRRQGQATVAGVKTWELAFAERGAPAVVRDGSKDLPASGSFWFDPVTGRVVRSTMRLKIGAVSIEVTVTYRPDARAGDTWVPAEMREVYLSATRRLECVATYSNIRRFQVTTEEVQKH